MFAIKVGHLSEGDIELGSISVGARVGHGELVLLGMLNVEVLILKLCPEDRFSTFAVAQCEIATLGHELGDDSVELAAPVTQRYAFASHSHISFGKTDEVFDSLRHGVAIQAKDDCTSVLIIDVDVKEDFLGDGVGTGVLLEDLWRWDVLLVVLLMFAGLLLQFIDGCVQSIIVCINVVINRFNFRLSRW